MIINKLKGEKMAVKERQRQNIIIDLYYRFSIFLISDKKRIFVLSLINK